MCHLARAAGTHTTRALPRSLPLAPCLAGQVMTVLPFGSDDEAVALANDCPFGLGSSVFSGSRRRARALASRLEAGMSSINDFNATYMCQGLPFGGVKLSGFGRFAGVEGLRALTVPKVRAPLLLRRRRRLLAWRTCLLLPAALCALGWLVLGSCSPGARSRSHCHSHSRSRAHSHSHSDTRLCLQAVAEDRWPLLMKTSIPPLWQHPVGPAATPFAEALTVMFYGPSLGCQLAGLLGVLRAVTGLGGSSKGGGGGAKAKAA